MKREEFFARLFQELRGISPEERQSIEEYYMELLMDEMEAGRKEEEAIAHFGEPEQIAARIRSEQENRQKYADKAEVELSIPVKEKDGEYRAREAVRCVRIYAQDVRINLVPARDGIFKIRYQKSEDEKITVTESEGCYTFRQEIPLLSRIFSFLRIGKGGIYVEIPQETMEEIEAVTSNAAVHAERLSRLCEIRLKTSNSRIALRELGAEYLSAKTSNGGIRADRCIGGQSEFTTSNARIECMNCGGRDMELYTSNGGIEVQNLEGENIVMRSSNAAIRGTILGREEDYNVDCGTSNASSNLSSHRNPSGKGRVSIHTSNAAIRIDFV